MCNNEIKKPLLAGLHSEVHIWFCSPDTVRDQTKISSYQSVLSAHELERRDRFRFETDKHDYLVSHAMLRHVLSKYALIDAAQWRFITDAHGKPALLSSRDLPDIKFNLTHTKGLSACVITLDKACGIDAENIHRKNKLDAVARRMFSDEELEVLSVDGERSFYDFWTLREAYVKALGTGLAGSSKEYYFSVTTDDNLNADGQAVSISFIDRRQADNNRWQFNLFKPTKDHRLAIAIEAPEALPVKITEFVP